MLALLAVLIAPAPDLPPTAFRWWDRGHHAVAALAWSRLSPKARGLASQLLAGDGFIQVSTWADSVRPHRRETAPWHYVNIAIWEPRFDP
ncbi:MAG: S1/P1 nuclease, partial [Gemmatimonadota bacterium]